MKVLNTVEALSLALFTVCDIETTSDADVYRIVGTVLTEADEQRVLRKAYLYMNEYRPQLLVK